MKTAILFFVLIFTAPNAFAWFSSGKPDASFQEYCLLDLLSKSNNDTAAKTIIRESSCTQLPTIAQRTPNRFQSRNYQSVSACVQKYGIETSSEFATRYIRRLCRTITGQ